LEDIGVIELQGGGSGQAKTPKLAYDGLEIDIPFTTLNEHRDAAAP
jgi:predicted transcriptional regulator